MFVFSQDSLYCQSFQRAAAELIPAAGGRISVLDLTHSFGCVGGLFVGQGASFLAVSVADSDGKQTAQRILKRNGFPANVFIIKDNFVENLKIPEEKVNLLIY